MILYGVVCTSRKHFCHFCPFVAMSAVCQKEDPFLMIGPIDFEDTRVEVVMPSLSALFAKAPGNMFSNHRPPLWAMLLY